MSESEIIKVYQEGIQSFVNLVQGLSTQISELSQIIGYRILNMMIALMLYIMFII